MHAMGPIAGIGPSPDSPTVDSFIIYHTGVWRFLSLIIGFGVGTSKTRDGRGIIYCSFFGL